MELPGGSITKVSVSNLTYNIPLENGGVVLNLADQKKISFLLDKYPIVDKLKPVMFYGKATDKIITLIVDEFKTTIAEVFNTTYFATKEKIDFILNNLTVDIVMSHETRIKQSSINERNVNHLFFPDDPNSKLFILGYHRVWFDKTEEGLRSGRFYMNDLPQEKECGYDTDGHGIRRYYPPSYKTNRRNNKREQI